MCPISEGFNAHGGMIGWPNMNCRQKDVPGTRGILRVGKDNMMAEHELPTAGPTFFLLRVDRHNMMTERELPTTGSLFFGSTKPALLWFDSSLATAGLQHGSYPAFLIYPSAEQLGRGVSTQGRP